MIRFLNSFFNFLLYSNLFIAVCAIALCLQTFAMQAEDPRWWLILEVFAATQCIYALHRLVSLRRLKAELINERFQNIRALKTLIWALFFAAAAIGFYGFWQLQFMTQLALVSPAILSLGYVLPFWKRKRLRDFHFIKIFLIAIVWSYVTVFLPAMELGLALDLRLFMIFIERSLFIFAITLPFDIRDMEIEEANGVKTIPAMIGAQNSIYLGMGILLIWVGVNFFLYELYLAFLLGVVGFFTIIVIWRSYPRKADWYYTGLLDGTMLIQGLFIYLML